MTFLSSNQTGTCPRWPQVELELTEDGAYALKDGAEPYVEYLVTRPEASERVFKTRIKEAQQEGQR